MKILHVIQLALLAHHVYGIPTTVAPLDPIKGKNINASEKCVEELDLSDMGLKKIDRNFLSAGSCIKSLILRGNSIEGFENGTFSNLTNLESLDLSLNKLSPTTLFSFGSVPSLKTLILDRKKEKWTNSTLDTKVYFPELTRLSLHGMNINSVAINWSEYFPKIEQLDISYSQLISMNEFFNNIPTTLRSLKMEVMGLTKLKIENLKNVTSLDLDFNVFRSIKRSNCGEEGLCLENLDGLESLSLRDCNIQLIEEHAFKHLTNLSYLNLHFNRITRIASGTFGRIPSLSYLDISENPLDDVSFISELQNLTTLRMHWMSDHSAIDSLFSVSTVPTKIQILSLTENRISSIPSRFLDNLQDLREINLGNNWISYLSPGSWQRNLKAIYLSNNNVSKIEDLHLSGARSLELLDLRENKLVSIDPEVKRMLPEHLNLLL
ncbi:hypothetical protein QAD02_004528 [Eretmocerus hayati]|uniref:Uncharacterized protein n=1 Tax=Eretmocerus hayati TaxID=131215 RepID=A0ACC2NQ45_9HYME|nr:hypothetical protein QAD02_004528 [Eretmocerus hayati]